MMKIIIPFLLVCTAVLAQDENKKNAPDAEKRMGYITSVYHGDESKKGPNQAQSSVKVNMYSNQGHQARQHIPSYSNPPQFIKYTQSNPIQTVQPNNQYLHYQKELQSQTKNEQYEEVNPEVFKLPNFQNVPQRNEYKLNGPSYYNNAPKWLQSQASNVKYIMKRPSSQQQLYNVGYSINIENNAAPKLMYRQPHPLPAQNAHSYRQQKMLNADVITGTHKDKVQKPSSFEQQEYNFPLPPNYLSLGQDKDTQQAQASFNYPEKQPVTKVYSDVTNSHGYTWKNLSPGVEISGYHSLNQPSFSPDNNNNNNNNNFQLNQFQDAPAHNFDHEGANNNFQLNQFQDTPAHHFDHEGALGRSQGFDISNVVDSGKSLNIRAREIQDTESKNAPVAENNNNNNSPPAAETSNAQSTENQQPQFWSQPTNNEQQNYWPSNYQQQNFWSNTDNPGHNFDFKKFLENPQNEQDTSNSNENKKYLESIPENQNFEFSKLADEAQAIKGIDGGSSSFDFATHTWKSTPLKIDENHNFDFGQFQNSELFNAKVEPFDAKLFAGEHEEWDKSLLSNFYQSFKPAIYSPEATLPAPEIPSHIGLNHASSNQNSVQAPSNEEQKEMNQQQVMMMNQHYAFVQAEEANKAQAQAYTQPKDEEKPVREYNIEQYQPQVFQPTQQTEQNQQIEMQMVPPQQHYQLQPPQAQQTEQMQLVPPQPTEQNMNILLGQQPPTKQREQKALDHKKYLPGPNSAPASRPLNTRSIIYDSNHLRLKTNLQPPPMLIIRKNY